MINSSVKSILIKITVLYKTKSIIYIFILKSTCKFIDILLNLADFSTYGIVDLSLFFDDICWNNDIELTKKGRADIVFAIDTTSSMGNAMINMGAYCVSINYCSIQKLNFIGIVIIPYNSEIVN